ncbi:fused MFS/spermidine synthase [Planctomyces sp. SH-PL14]|uniref:fused MFS/spermidine synthase n=1 Tax=Planctomyces sp. SH-PL14 TaxID=1632864 RepID=UPI00078C1B4F|nr:fused MFS/spermidine synthase [Planctomyces sp. SH-PL14]AMV19035.1 spermidine synthase [Planctomyces sp. SH-PL14]
MVLAPERTDSASVDTPLPSAPSSAPVPIAPAPAPLPGWLAVSFTATAFLSALLLFQVQPLIGKVLLPWFGGSPGVWTAAMLVFQWLLLAGYAYAHLVTRWLPPAGQALLHLALLAGGFALLPILPGAAWKPTGSEEPWTQVVRILLASVGGPFFVLSTTGPLVQAWFARLGQGASAYRLYAVSNAGSLLALLSYPFLVEPFLPIARQSALWSAGYAAFSLLCGGLAVAAWRRAPAALPAAESTLTPAATAAPAPGLREMALWFALGMVPSVLMLATTNQVCADIAPVPFLWLVPLSLYLLSFILCFESRRWYSRRLYLSAFAVMAFLMTGTLLLGENVPILPQACVFFGGLFCGAMLCHGELSRRVPAAGHLTLFYLVLALAGAAGGTFVSLVAPRIFDSYYELHVALLAALGLVLVLPAERGPSAAAGAWERRGAWAALVLLAVGLGTAAARERQGSVLAVRNFFGVLRVAEDQGARQFRHGRIVHGRQLLDAGQRRVPTAYYGERSGVGLAMRMHRADRPRRVGVVGLGIGTLAAYAKAGDEFACYELDPDVVRIAREEFSFLADAPAEPEVILGDARLALERERDRGTSRRFDILAVDAFSGDAVPIHLLTREAFGLYLDHLAPDGILAVHVSNRHLDLVPVVAAAVQEWGLESRLVATRADLVQETDSLWALLSPAKGAFADAAFRDAPSLARTPVVRWTDDFGSLASVLKAQDFRLLWGDSGAQRDVDEGLAALGRGDLPAAEAAFRRALEAEPRSAPTWIHLGNVLRRGRNTADAMRAYLQAIEIDDVHSEAHNNLGMLLTASDRRRAEKHIRRALELDPRNAEAHNSLGNLLAQRGKLDEAIGHYERALAIKPSLDGARQNLQTLREWQAKGGATGKSP